ncbi:MAG: diguanylate cyclase [Candidatus Acidiferrum sp.]|jgi:diguanylate cyclase (GGDEF)-like protein
MASTEQSFATAWAFMANLAHKEAQSNPTAFHAERSAAHRSRTIRVLFVHRDTRVVDGCLEELHKAGFIVTADVASSLAQGSDLLRSRSYEVLLAGWPMPNLNRVEVSQILEQVAENLPILFVADAGGEYPAQLTTEIPFDYIERGHLAQLPMAVRRALKEAVLRAELAEAGKALRHSQSLYRALVENPAYGVCRCDGEGNLLDANQALLSMLGHASKEELFAANRASEFILDLGPAAPLGGPLPAATPIEPIEIAWPRKNGTMLKARLSGRGIFDEQGAFLGYEIIVVDITDQRALEEHLRRQASTDSLTDLANHRRLLEVLHAEIARSKRTGREFSVLLLDLDGLKQINDRFGHMVGNRALARLAQILLDCCRSVDTAARQGGDEFAVVLPEAGVAAATLVADRIADLLRKDIEAPALSVSIGVASFPKDADAIGTLLYAADCDLYAMKKKSAPNLGSAALPQLS